ncbi:MAG TPA: response regulator [Allosphingosinicella sp.]|nr:response regulator [Allosphingosinicella sp.]
MRLLIVEDSVALANELRAAFARRNMHCDVAHNAGDAEQLVHTINYAAIVLDLGLPDEDGLTLLKRLRSTGRVEPCIILTARSEAAMRVTGLTWGADDYVVKPFLFDELKARIDAILRRQGGYIDRQLKVAQVTLDSETREVCVDGVLLDLSSREAELLEILMRRVDHVVPKRVLEDQLFGAGDALGSNAVEVYVHRIRRKLEERSARIQVQTVRGVGYLLSAT